MTSLGSLLSLFLKWVIHSSVISQQCFVNRSLQCCMPSLMVQCVKRHIYNSLIQKTTVYKHCKMNLIWFFFWNDSHFRFTQPVSTHTSDFWLFGGFIFSFSKIINIFNVFSLCLEGKNWCRLRRKQVWVMYKWERLTSLVLSNPEFPPACLLEEKWVSEELY